MKKIEITKNTPDNLRIKLIKFICKHSDGHITLRAIKWLRNTTFSSLDYKNGDLIHICLNKNNRICGVIAVSQYGLQHSIVVVHSKMRKKGIGTKLLNEVANNLNCLYLRVAYDNIPSLKLCFSVGMKAFKLIKGPTGKPTLVLGIGNYNLEEWNSYNK